MANVYRTGEVSEVGIGTICRCRRCTYPILTQATGEEKKRVDTRRDRSQEAPPRGRRGNRPQPGLKAEAKC